MRRRETKGEFRRAAIRTRSRRFSSQTMIGTQASLRLLFECEGLKAREFASCDEFLVLFGLGRATASISTLKCRGMSGLELSETLRGNGDTLPVIIVNGRVEARRPQSAHRRVAAQPLRQHLDGSKGSRFAFRCVKRRLSPVTCTTRDLPLPRPVREVILASKPSGSWRMSAESLAHRGTGVSQGYST